MFEKYFDMWYKNDKLNISEKKNSLVFGAVQYVDEFNVSINSTANLRHFSYVGPDWWRILNFVFTPWLFGKMILCWGLFPRELLLEETKKVFISKWGGAVDSVWVFSVLSKSIWSSKFYLEVLGGCNNFLGIVIVLPAEEQKRRTGRLRYYF